MTKKDREEIDAFALIAWLHMDASQRAGCKFGMFPFELQQAAANRGLDVQACLSAIMRKAQTDSFATH